MEELFGRQLQLKSRLVLTRNLTAKYKLIFFSAHWCSPCRAFTPQLALFYELVNESSHQLDIIYVSSDNSLGEFNEYFATMPWLALPFEERNRARGLSWKFGADGIPLLVLIDNNGKKKSITCRADVISKGPQCLAIWDKLLNKK